jgi:hypothetical protein
MGFNMAAETNGPADIVAAVATYPNGDESIHCYSSNCDASLKYRDIILVMFRFGSCFKIKETIPIKRAYNVTQTPSRIPAQSYKLYLHRT